MPICPTCGIAYLDGESHVCPSRVSVGFVIVMLVVGVVLGAFIGGEGQSLGCLAVGAPCGEGALFSGVPIGAIVGGAVGMKYAFSRKKPRSN